MGNLLLHVHGQEWNSANSCIFLLLWLIIHFIKKSFKQIQNSTLKKNPLTQIDSPLLEKRETPRGAFLATIREITEEMLIFFVKILKNLLMVETVNRLPGKVQEKASS